MQMNEIHKFNPKTDYDLYYENTDCHVLKHLLGRLQQESYITPRNFISTLSKADLLEIEDVTRKAEAYARDSNESLYREDHKNLVIIIKNLFFAEGIHRATTHDFLLAIQQLIAFVNLEISKRFYGLETELYYKHWSLEPELISFKKD